MADLVQLGFEVDSSDVKTASKDLDGLTASSKKTDQSLKKTKATTDKTRVTFDAFGNQVKKTNTQLVNTSKAATKASKGMSNIRGIAGQAGFQLQDVAVQAQMGTNAFVILGQQGSQFAGAFGPTGAVVGAVIAVGAALAGVFAAGAEEARQEIEWLTDSTDDLLERIDQLSLKEAEALLGGRNNLIDRRNQMLEYGEEIRKTNGRIETLRMNLSRGIGSAESITKWTRELKDLLAVQEDYDNQLKTLNDQIARLQAQVAAGADNTDKQTDAEKNRASSLDRLIQSLKLKTIAEKESEEAAIRQKALDLGANESQIKTINLYLKEIEAVEAKVAAQKKAAEQSRILAAQLKADEVERARIVSSGLGGLSKETPEQKAQQRLKALALANEQELALIGGRFRAEILIEKEKLDAINELRDKAAKEEMQRQKALFSSQVTLLSSLANFALENLQRKSQGEDEAAKKAFDKQKDLSRGIALMQGAAGVANALAFGDPITKWIDAAAVATNTASQVAAINATSFGGGANASQAPQAPTVSNNTTNNNSASFTVNASGDADPDAIVRAIQEAASDGAVFFDRSTEQAQILR